VIATDVPIDPEVGVMVEIVGKTVNAIPLLDRPLTVTTTGPLVAPGGTGTTIDVAFHATGLAGVPLNVAALVPCVEPKFAPVIVIAEPIAAAFADKLVILGTWRTVNGVPLLLTPFTVTTTFPDVAPAGTGTVIPVALQFVGVPAVPLKVTVLVP